MVSKLRIIWKQTVPPTNSAPGGVSVEVTLKDVGQLGLRSDILPHNYQTEGHLGKIPYPVFDCRNFTDPMTHGRCAWASIQISSGTWLNASIFVSGIATLTMIAPLPAGVTASVVPTASAYGWGAIPLMNVYSGELPVLPWNETLV